MKRIIASGIGVIALGGFLAFQPVAGGAGGGGLTFTPTQPQASASSSATSTPTTTIENAQTPAAPAAPVAKPEAKISKAPQIKGGGHGDDDDEYENDEHEGRDD